MALTPEQIAAAVIKGCRKKRLASYQIRTRCSELVGAWLRSTPWFLREYPTHEQQTELYKKVRVAIYRLTAPKKKPARKESDPTPAKDPRNLTLF